jgi:hypothetical protein
VKKGRLPVLGRNATRWDDDELADEQEPESFRELADAVSSLKGAVPFAVGGCIALNESDRGVSLVIRNAECKKRVPGVLRRVDPAALLPHRTKAAFGDAAQRTNREDPSVRVAFELEAG